MIALVSRPSPIPLRGLIALRPSRLAYQAAGVPFTQSFVPSVLNGDATSLGTQKFPWAMSFRIVYPAGTENPAQASHVNSSLNLVDAKVYSRLQIRRFMVTTIALMTTVAPSSTGKFPASVARLITAPSPVIEKV